MIIRPLCYTDSQLWVFCHLSRLNAAIAQQPNEMGRIAVDTVYEYFAGGAVEDEIAAPLELITAE